MNLSPIRKLVKKTKQHDPKGLGRDSIIYIDISSIDRQTKRISEPQIIPVDEAPSRARKQVYADDVLVSTVRPNLNAVTLVPTDFHDEIASTGFCVLRTKKDMLDPRYLFYFTQTSDFISRLTRLSIGAGYPAVSDSTILDTEIPLPPLPEQQRSAAILAKADRLRRLRRTARELSDTYLQSVFLEMFGDPVSNPRGWQRVTLKQLNAKSFMNGVSLTQEDMGHGTKLVNVVDLYENHTVDTSKLGRASVSERQLEKHTLRKGDIVFVRSSVKRAGAAMCALFPGDEEPVVFGCFNIRLRPNLELVDPQYLSVFLRIPEGRRRLLSFCRTATITNINQDGLGAVRVPLPPLPLQQEFAHIVHKFERLRAQQREAERQAEHLFQTLLHRAFTRETFRGEV